MRSSPCVTIPPYTLRSRLQAEDDDDPLHIETYGRGSRPKKSVLYADGLTERQFLKVRPEIT